MNEPAGAEQPKGRHSWISRTEDVPKSANPGLRLLALILDIALYGGLIVGIMMVANAPAGDEASPLGAALAVVVLYFYPPVCTALWSGTPGKLICGLRVVRNSNGLRVGFDAALGRFLVHMLCSVSLIFGLLDHLWCLNKDDGRCLHDKASGTRVILAREAPKLPSDT